MTTASIETYCLNCDKPATPFCVQAHDMRIYEQPPQPPTMTTATSTAAQFIEQLQAWLDARGASIFFGEYHGEIWVDGERIGAVTHNDVAELEEHHCDC